MVNTSTIAAIPFRGVIDGIQVNLTKLLSANGNFTLTFVIVMSVENKSVGIGVQSGGGIRISGGPMMDSFLVPVTIYDPYAMPLLQISKTIQVEIIF